MIALVDDGDAKPGDQKPRFGVCLCRPHGLMWLKDRFTHFRLKPHEKPKPEPDSINPLSPYGF